MLNNNNISVICPVYNSGPYIKRTLQHLLEQEIHPEEIIFSDDGSVDDTVEILEDWKPEFTSLGINIVILKNNHQGPGENRNIGIRAARGNWIAFLDSDDLWTPVKIKKVVDIINNNQDINFIIHWEVYEKMSGETSVLEHGSKYDLTQDLPKQIYTINYLSTSAITCKKSLIEKAGFFDKILQVSQDYELWLRMSPFIRMFIIEEVLGSYVEISTSITARPYYKRYPYLVRILFHHWKKGGLFIFLYRLARVSLSKQWFHSVKLFVKGVKGHYG